MSLAAYPWPQTLESDVVDSQHVNMWEDFCINKFEQFINFFPFFLMKKRSSYSNVLKEFYFLNDDHFNKRENILIAEKLI